MQGLPNIKNYGDYASDNYGAHSLVITLGQLEVYFSYKTPVAFCTNEDGLVCSENIWSTSTGKHLNWIQSDKSKRIKNADFDARLTATLKRFGLLTS